MFCNCKKILTRADYSNILLSCSNGLFKNKTAASTLRRKTFHFTHVYDSVSNIVEFVSLQRTKMSQSTKSLHALDSNNIYTDLKLWELYVRTLGWEKLRIIYNKVIFSLLQAMDVHLLPFKFSLVLAHFTQEQHLIYLTPFPHSHFQLLS